jgi:hypothetical protein
MHLPFLVVGLIVVFSSCNQKAKPTSWIENIQETDTACLKELEKAKADIKQNKLTYCHDAGSLLYVSLRCSYEMDSLLNILGISYKEEVTSDVIYEDQIENCFCKYMSENIGIKFGERFIDSLLNAADSLYLTNNIMNTFKYTNCDTRAVYPGDTDIDNNEFSEFFQSDFDKIIKYPSGYKKKSESSAFADVDMYIDKNGRCSIIGYWFVFDIQDNQKYEGRLKKTILRALKKKDWVPATVRNQKVNSDMVLRLYFN